MIELISQEYFQTFIEVSIFLSLIVKLIIDYHFY